MEATVIITKSFVDQGKKFTKEWSLNDFKKFFESEGEYLDKLVPILNDKGNIGDSFEVTYIVKVTK